MEQTEHFVQKKHIATRYIYLESEFSPEVTNWMEPVKISGYANGWPALKLWNESYLIRQSENKLLPAKRIINGIKETKSFFLKDYFSYVDENNDTLPFYLSDCQFHLNTEMESHYFVPKIFKCWYGEIDSLRRKSTLSWLYIGARRSQSPLHIDMWNTSAWNVVLKGRKLWLFFPPSQEELLYEGKVNPFYPDDVQYPKFRTAIPIVCIQEPSEIVYTPSGWWHAVYNLEAGISITENFINALNYDHVLTFFKQRSIPSYETMDQIVKQHIIT